MIIKQVNSFTNSEATIVVDAKYLGPDCGTVLEYLRIRTRAVVCRTKTVSDICFLF